MLSHLPASSVAGWLANSYLCKNYKQTVIKTAHVQYFLYMHMHV